MWYDFDSRLAARNYGGSGGGVSSWNDLTDKPFYEESSVVEVLAETTVDTSAGYDVIYGAEELFVGKTYIVGWNGTKYECQVTESDGGTVVLRGENTPFAVRYAPPDGPDRASFAIFALDGSTSAVISIYRDNTVIHPIEGKYLPKGTPWIEGNVYLDENDAFETTHPSFGKTWFIRGAPLLEVGKTYTIVYNGTSYNCVCQSAPAGISDDTNALAMGNFSVVGGANTGEPFAMLISHEYQRIDIIDLVGSSSVKVAIYAGGTTIRKAEWACLPSGVPKLFNVTISANGNGSTISADKTFAEIYKAAFDTNTIVRATMFYMDRIFKMPLTMWHTGEIHFGSSLGIYYMDVYILDDETVDIDTNFE